MGILERIKRLVREIVCKSASAQVAKSAPAPKHVANVRVPVPEVHAHMHPTSETITIGGVVYPVYHERGLRNRPHIKAGNTFISVGVFKVKR